MHSCQADAHAPTIVPVAPVYTNEFSHWGEAMSQRLLSFDAPRQQPSENFAGQATIARFHQCVVADIRTTAHKVMRTRSLVSSDNDRYFKVMWQVSGRNQIGHSGQSFTIDPGQWAIYDTAKPYTVDTSDRSRFLVLLLPASQLGRWEADIEFAAGNVMASRGTSEIARAALTGLLADGVELGHTGAKVMQDSIGALLGAAIAQVHDGVAETDGRAMRRLRKARSYIDDNLTHPDLSPQAVALACGMSRRSLYTAFNAIGQTPNNYIQQQRLAEAAQRLADPNLRLTITQLAFELGFSDGAHFSRVFSERYGLTPSNWRSQG
jgi:AraC-like DNA-binding protein